MVVVFSRLLGIDLPTALECDDSGRNPAFEIAFSADGVIPFPQARNRGRTTFSISIRRKPWSVPYS